MALVKVVSDELTDLMGSKGAKDLEQGFPQIVLMAGLQVYFWLYQHGISKLNHDIRKINKRVMTHLFPKRS
jgi:signal recognition particle GTPase